MHQILFWTGILLLKMKIGSFENYRYSLNAQILSSCWCVFQTLYKSANSSSTSSASWKSSAVWDEREKSQLRLNMWNCLWSLNCAVGTFSPHKSHLILQNLLFLCLSRKRGSKIAPHSSHSIGFSLLTCRI